VIEELFAAIELIFDLFDLVDLVVRLYEFIRRLNGGNG
jgi:hypothetical protein